MTTLGSIPSNQELITGTNVTLGGLNLASLYPDPGVDKPASLKVTQRGAGANMSVDVAAGSAYVPDGSSGINLISKASVTNVAVAGGAGGGIRHDFVTIDSTGTIAVLQGSVGTDPTPATNTHVLARIRVPQNETTSIDNADIDDKREYGSVFRRPNGNGAQIESSSSTTVASGSSMVIDLDAENWAIGLTTDTVNGEIDIPNGFDDRRWLVSGYVGWGSGNSTARRRSTINEAVSDIDLVENAIRNGAAFSGQTPGSDIVTLDPGNRIRLLVFQDSGGDETVNQRARLTVSDAGGLDKPTGSEGQ